MKKLILFLTLAIVTSAAYAQVRNQTAYGMRLGANFSTLDTDFIDDPSGRIAPSVTFFAEIPLGSTFALVPEFSFDALGVKENRVIPSNGNAVDLKANWLSGGLLAQINLSNRFYLNLGPKLAINVSENDDGDYYDGDLLGVGGLGYRITDNFSIDARYGYGFTNVFEGQLVSDGFEANQRFFQFTVSYRL